MMLAWAVVCTLHPAQATIICAGPGSFACKDGAPNGVCQQGEECDDGNTINGDGCDSNCMRTDCGNGVTSDGEECDSGAANDDVNLDQSPDPGDACDTSCRLKQCGNGRVEGGEQCDDGNLFNNDTCDSDPDNVDGIPPDSPLGNCLLPICGNGITNMNEMSGCDDGNNESGDGCSATCQSEFCGDGVVNDGPPGGPGEECDDGNTNTSDACGKTGNQCLSNFCGDSVTQSGMGENCDDGGTVSNDGCSATCQSEFCGDGVSQTGEACDDGNTADDETCSGDCSKVPVCGDGVTDPGAEECDSGACRCVAPKKAANGRSCASAVDRAACTADGGTCFNTATLSPCGTTAGDGNIDDLPDFCRTSCESAACGDGVTDSGELCDDGLIGPEPQDADDTDSCPNGTMMFAMGMACQVDNVCGDGVPNFDDGPNSCDNGNGTNPKTCLLSGVLCSIDEDCGTDAPCGNSDTDPDACRTTCVPAFCGDGVTDSPELCDDGDTITGPDCLANCASPGCGDGIVIAPEACDPGITFIGVDDPCTDTCLNAVCGDRKVCSASGCTSGPTGGVEECDDGNIYASDECDDCRINVCGDGVTRTGGPDPLEQCDDGNSANQDGCSQDCCLEPGNGGSLEGMFAAQQCNLDNLVIDLAALTQPNGPAPRIAKTAAVRAVRRARVIQSVARSAHVKSRDARKLRTQRQVRSMEKRVGRLLINLQRMLDRIYQAGDLPYAPYAEISAQRVIGNGHVNQIIDTYFPKP